MAPFTIDAREPDIRELASFYSTQTGEPAASIRPRLDWQARNPSRINDVPMATCARLASGAIAGAMLTIPHRLRRDGVELTALMSSGFYVDRSIRGAGLQIFLKYRALSSRYPLYATTANASSERLWRSAGASPLARTDYEWLRPVSWPPIVEEMLVRKTGKIIAPLARLLSLAAHLRREGFGGAKGELSRIDRPQDAVIPMTSNDLQPVRDEAFVRWRFFEAPQADPVVYRYRDPSSGADAFVAITRSLRGHRSQLRTISLADVWGTMPAPALPGMLDALALQHRRDADLIAVRALPVDLEDRIGAAGFRRRAFEYPIGWCLDPRGVLGAAPVAMPTAATELV
jgi:hypothetical protein